MNLEIGDFKDFIQELLNRKIKMARIFSSFSNDGYATTFKIKLSAAAYDYSQPIVIACEIVVGREFNIESIIQALADKTKSQAAEIKKELAKEKIDLKPGVWKI